MLHIHNDLASRHTMKTSETPNNSNGVSLSLLDHNGCMKYMNTRNGACGTLADCTEALNIDQQGKKRSSQHKIFHSTKSVQHLSGTAYCQLDSPVAFEASLDLSLARLQAPL